VKTILSCILSALLLHGYAIQNPTTQPQPEKPASQAAEVTTPRPVLAFGLEDGTPVRLRINRGYEAIKACDSAIHVSNGNDANLEPSIDAIGPAITEFFVKGSSGFEGIRNGGHDALEVIWMNHAVGSRSVQFLDSNAEVFQYLAMASSILPAGLKVHRSPGILSIIWRRLISLARTASSARFRSSSTATCAAF